MMQIPIENRCRICRSVFCCEKCRARHEMRTHPKEIDSILILSKICSLCRAEPFMLQTDISPELLTHIVEKHLPLYCKKCCKTYTNEGHLMDGEKCFAPRSSCSLESQLPIVINDENLAPISISKIDNNQQLVAVSTQTSPSLYTNETSRTPLCMIEKQWKQKRVSCDGSLMDSISSLKNISSLSMSNQKTNSSVTGGKLVRTTSTPMQQLLAAVQEKHFDSSDHVSSIHTSSATGESDASPSTENYVTAASTSNGKPEGKLQRNRGRGKMPVSATPLRQVMSKSIQRAIAEHGSYRNQIMQPKKIFDSLNISTSFTPPLDLRTTPVLRRTQSEVVDRSSLYEEFHTSHTSSRKHIIASSKRIVTEDLIISSNSVFEKFETVYQTCRNFESSTDSRTEQLLKITREKSTDQVHVTPKPFGGCLKKTNSLGVAELKSENEEDYDDVFYTPTRSYTEPDMSPNYDSKTNLQKSSSGSEKESEKQSKNPGKLWSLVTSVMRLASFGKDSNKPIELQGGSMGIVKRCASFAGVLTRQSDNDRTSQQAKRKRTNTFDAYTKISPESNNSSHEGPSKRVKRIQGRKPIERMRNISQNF